jgi:tRNA threonylcarbamoyladenosine biosynthesis protein TsaE
MLGRVIARKSDCLYLSGAMDHQLLEISYTLADIDKAAVKFWETCGAYRVFAFSGELGAGKTTFIHKLCDHLQVQDAVSSPTFALINEYHFAGAKGEDEIIFHLDWYRLRDSAEAINAGMEDCLMQAGRGAAYCFIEWPEKAVELLRPPYLWISIESPEILERKMTVKVIAG